jgi:thiol:disulfide interchange protein DsbD
MKKLLLLLILIYIVPVSIFSLVKNPVKWQYSYKFLNKNIVELKLKASIDKGWHMYGAFFPQGGPIVTTFHFEPSPFYSKIDTIKEVTKPERFKDPNFDMEVAMHSGKAEFIQKFALKKNGEFTLKGSIEFQACDNQMCLPPKNEEFAINIKPNIVAEQKTEKTEPSVSLIDSSKIAKTDSVKPETKPAAESFKAETDKGFDGSQSLWLLFLKAFLAGLGAILTPCVYPMIPLTVMFFLRGSENKQKAIFKGLYFGISIILIYTILGILFGQFLQSASQHWFTNLVFFALFVAFALSFLGLFEIVLPSSLATKIDQQADKGGYFAIFFMALALVIVSTSCTVPILGWVIIESTSNFASSLTGMLGYSIAFALPFSFLSMFPALLKNLPNSGGWLNAFKVIIGLCLLLFSFKFLVIVDQSLHLNILNREIVISIWATTLILAGFYLLGKIKLPHDSDIQYISVPRFILALIAFSYGVYFLVNVFVGGNLANYASFLPAKSIRPTVSISQEIKSSSNALCGTPQYSDILNMSHGLQGYFDYEEGMACAKQQNKPVLLDFKGHSCANCKIMEAKVWSDEQVLKLLRENFIIIALYCDERAKLPENKWITSKIDGKIKKTLGQLNEDIEINMFKTNALPLYVIVSPDGTPLTKPIGTELNVKKYIDFLNQGIANYKK